ncbi:Poly A polymerase [Trema orientale]|uniref:Poly A polymerase n=1 Tax=Trema orientale TaxID=63057 RepID=A0A2P5F224_TREOI|nr:Poly A polymerase [Trema orientale]
MTVAAFGVVAWRTHLSLSHCHRLPLLCLRKVGYSGSKAAVESVAEPAAGVSKKDGHRVGKDRKEPEWKKFDSKELGVKMSSISKPTRLVLSRLRKKGYEVYLVGGCVRDLILNRTPKDFDVITSAELKEVKKTFPNCEIVGKRFPICHVHVYDTAVEVSSFSTCGSTSSKKFDNNFIRPPGCSRPDYIRWRNCLQRDFTINGLMFDPYTKIVYDYMGGIQDIRKAKMRTVVPANVSFVEDCARILRAIRIAARLGFHFTKDLALSLKELSWSIKRLDKGRILMEMNYMLAFGSSEASMRLLWRFGLLEMLLPVQASYFASQGFRRRDERSNMLLSLFSNLDKFVAPNQPCHSSLWIAILAFHKALVEQPRDPLVVAAFSIAVSSGGSLSEAVEIAKTISQPPETMFNEILEPVNTRSSNAVIDEVLDLAASVKAVLRKMTDRDYVSRAMIKFPKAPRSDLVFIPLALSLRVCKIFQCIRRELERGSVPKIGKKIDYESLALGSLPEVQHMFATVVFNTVYPVNRKR